MALAGKAGPVRSARSPGRPGWRWSTGASTTCSATERRATEPRLGSPDLDG
jgi:hypothetical protein